MFLFHTLLQWPKPYTVTMTTGGSSLNTPDAREAREQAAVTCVPVFCLECPPPRVKWSITVKTGQRALPPPESGLRLSAWVFKGPERLTWPVGQGGPVPDPHTGRVLPE